MAEEQLKIIVSEEERLEMEGFLDKLVSWDMVLRRAVTEIVLGQTVLRKKMRIYWAGLRKKYALDPKTNYNMNELTGEVYGTGPAAVPPVIKPEKPKKPL